MAPNTPKNLYYTVPLDDDDLESQDYYLQEKKAPWFSVPIRSSDAVSTCSSPLSVLKEKLWSSWSNDNDNHHVSNTRSEGHGGSRGFWDRWIWLVHTVLLTISMTLFALSMCTSQTAASTNAAAVQCQNPQGEDGMNGASNFVPRSFFDEEQMTAPAPAVVLPVPIVVPESQHVDMEVSVDDRTSVEDVD